MTVFGTASRTAFSTESGKPHPVLQTAAILVVPVVGSRRKELCQKVVVGAVDHQDLKPRLLTSDSAVDKLLPDVGHILFLSMGLI